MCGFAGTLREDAKRIHGLSPSAVAHRGPDAEYRLDFGALRVAFYRLAINGVANGQQPFISEEVELLTVVNGEIYNHVELRARLAELGAVFDTNSDAEVVHWGFHYWGVGVFEKLEGMFAVAIFEKEANRLTFARDRLGKKPLYWCREGDSVSFASEIGALDVPPGVFSSGMLATYMLTDAVAWEDLSGSPIRSLPGGHWAQIDANGETVESFWNLESAVVKHRTHARSRKDWYQGFLDVVTESVSQRLMSEVPVGVFLSDGKDSKLVTALASSLGQIDVAYTLQFQELSFDESSKARNFAEGLGIAHEMVSADIDSLADVWRVYRGSIDEPVADSAILGELLLARAAGPKTKVVLTGDGGDETLLGYQHVAAHSVAAIPGALPTLRFFLRLARPLFGVSNEKYFSPGFVVDRFLRGAGEGDLIKRDLAWRSSFPEEMVRGLVKNVGEEDINNAYSTMKGYIPESEDLQTWQDRWGFLYIRSYLHHVILRKVDRATMRFGVEARSPLLDRKVVEYAMAMPHRYRRGLFSTKLPIDYALKRIAGTDAGQGNKHGMGIPLVTLFRGPLRDEVRALVDRDFLVNQGLFEPDAVGALMESFEHAPQAHVREVWSLLVFQTWWQNQQNKALTRPEKSPE